MIVRWPAKDLREDVLVVDVSRLTEDQVGVRRRRNGVFGRVGPPPAYPDEVEFVELATL